MRTADFDYHLPDSAIAQIPAEPRDSSRLLLTSDLTDHVFAGLPDLVNPEDVVVVNDTRVRAARLHLRKEGSGGSVELLLLEREDDRKWRGLVRPARRLSRGTVLVSPRIRAEILDDPVEGMVTVSLDVEGDVEDAVEGEGEMPLPPYITTPLDDSSRYQTIYAREPGSAAAPTAGLHFTPNVLDEVERKVAAIARVELRVGIGTFRPISTERVEDHQMHREWISVPEEAVAAVRLAREGGGQVIAVGTTVVRALEAAARGGELEPWAGYTELFISPGYHFAVVDRLLTNFHMPRSSLLVMVAAFMGPGWRAAYDTALARGYRFLSFGDAMLADRRAA